MPAPSFVGGVTTVNPLSVAPSLIALMSCPPHGLAGCRRRFELFEFSCAEPFVGRRGGRLRLERRQVLLVVRLVALPRRRPGLRELLTIIVRDARERSPVLGLEGGGAFSERG